LYFPVIYLYLIAPCINLLHKVRPLQELSTVTVFDNSMDTVTFEDEH
jgi:hypothetical protein